MLSPDAAWQRLFRIRQVLAHQPAVAHAVARLSLHDQLQLTMQLLHDDWPETESVEVLPANVIPFRPRRQR